MTPKQAWLQLLKVVEQMVPKCDGGGHLQIQWLRSNRLVLSGGKWPVQARFIAESEKYSIYFERFGADVVNQNFRLTPGSGPKTLVWTMLLEISNCQAFWRFSNGPTLTSTVLAQRVLARLTEFESEYAMSIIAPGY